MKTNVGLELEPLELADMETVRAWRNDYAIWRWSRQSDLISRGEQAAWFERQSSDPTSRFYKLVKVVGTTREAVGSVSLTGIDWINRRAEFGIYVPPPHQRQGIAREAMKILLGHAFLNLNIEQVWGETMDGNPALGLFQSIGMTVDGTRRAFYFKDGKMHDAHLVSILRSDWIKRIGSALEPHRPGAERAGANEATGQAGGDVPRAAATVSPIRRGRKPKARPEGQLGGPTSPEGAG